MKPKQKLLTFWAFTYIDNNGSERCIVYADKKEARDGFNDRVFDEIKCGPVTKIQLPAAGGRKKP